VFVLNLVRLNLATSSTRTYKWSGFRSLNLQRPVAAGNDPPCPPRNIYIDAGANLANSMDWHVPCPLPPRCGFVSFPSAL
jgi:hypothetical protein